MDLEHSTMEMETTIKDSMSMVFHKDLDNINGVMEAIIKEILSKD